MFAAVFVSLQFAVPVYQLTRSRAERFGWQMFAGQQAREVLKAVLSDGRELELNPALYLGHVRSEMDFEPLAGPLCKELPGAVEIVVDREGAARRRYPCR